MKRFVVVMFLGLADYFQKSYSNISLSHTHWIIHSAQHRFSHKSETKIIIKRQNKGKYKLKGIDFNMKIPKMKRYYLRSFQIKNSINTSILLLFSTNTRTNPSIFTTFEHIQATSNKYLLLLHGCRVCETNFVW